MWRERFLEEDGGKDEGRDEGRDGSISMDVIEEWGVRADVRKALLPLAGSRICPWLCLSDHMALTMWGGVKN